MPADLVIRNARIIDGSGAAAFPADVSISGDRITAVGTAGAGAREVDAKGQVLSPGFVDTHSHDDGAFLLHPDMAFKLAQGVTTDISGNCGFSTIPNEPGREYMPGDISGPGTMWRDLEGYFEACLAQKPAINNAMLVGHNRVRAHVVGLEKRPATAAEVAEMCGHIATAMEQGAVGFSTGLIYEPGRYSTTDEVVALAKECRPYTGIYATHMRNEGDKLLEAVDEALHIAREAAIPLHISHHKSAGRRNWGRVTDSLAKIDAANAAGMDVTLDVYPYTAGSGPMWQYVNLDNIDTEWAEGVMIASCPDHRDFEGRMVPDIATEQEWTIDETVREIVTSPRGRQVICIHFIIDEADIETNLRHPKMLIGSDGIPELKGNPHPRLFGTMPRVLARYVRERNVLTLEDAVRRMTHASCLRFGLVDRGLVREGYYADLVLFDPGAVKDLATYEQPKQEPAGISMVIVNGEVACENGRHTGVGSGRMLRFKR
ncbi:D-aminoacylase [Candidatus Amarobacter glycogenicus]|uniref:N-acyl-D-amino-acid deacylase family protein n=1 Tax=Candidatus Amarobacter glycogenicus TaxID=3140699 RepID=UPI00313545CA|nr:D-aminoacylase [Dehalococcoidia bacterium]